MEILKWFLTINILIWVIKLPRQWLKLFVGIYFIRTCKAEFFLILKCSNYFVLKWRKVKLAYY